MKIKRPNILVTGGSGFLGSSIVKELLSEDSPLKPGRIVVFDLQAYKGVKNDKVEVINSDVRDYSALEKASEGMDIVIHCAAIIDWGTRSKQEVLSVNVGGTKNVIKACEQNHIHYLVYTSSLDAVFSGKPLVNIDEDQPYPASYHTVYCESKVLGEQAVLEAHSSSLKTCILRPSDIYGEADPYHMDALIGMAKSGFYVRLGNGKSKCQHVYVGNIAFAHVLAAKALWTENKKVEKQIYFITDAKGVNFFSFFDQIVAGAGYKIFPANLWLPYALAYSIGSISEFIAVLWRPIKHYNPKFSRFAVIYTCMDFTFKSQKAVKDFDFQPKYSHEQALQNTIDYYARNKG
jgi:nucleoside-diphosphate-sugar epimerase